MMRISSLIAALAGVCLHGAAAAQTPEQMTLLGVQVGQSIGNLPECRGAALSKSARTAEVCIDRSTYRQQKDGSDMYLIVIPEAMRPGFIEGGAIMVTVIDQEVQTISVRTTGVRGQEETLKQLTDKYGPPATHRVEIVQNGFGAKFDVVKAAWKFDNLIVSFSGAVGNVTEGQILAINPAALAQQIQERRRAPKL